jgi:hypothetical protein
MKQKDNVTFYFYRPYIDSFFSLVYILLSLPSQLYLLLYLFIMHCVRHTFSHPRYLVPNWVMHLLLSTSTYFSCFNMVHPSFFLPMILLRTYLFTHCTRCPQHIRYPLFDTVVKPNLLMCFQTCILTLDFPICWLLFRWAKRDVRPIIQGRRCHPSPSPLSPKAKTILDSALCSYETEVSFSIPFTTSDLTLFRIYPVLLFYTSFFPLLTANYSHSPFTIPYHILVSYHIP